MEYSVFNLIETTSGTLKLCDFLDDQRQNKTPPKIKSKIIRLLMMFIIFGQNLSLKSYIHINFDGYFEKYFSPVFQKLVFKVTLNSIFLSHFRIVDENMFDIQT